MVRTATIVCGSPELAADAQALATCIGGAVATPVERDPFAAALALDGIVGVAASDPPSSAALLALDAKSPTSGPLVALLGDHPAHRALLCELGVPTVAEIGPLLSLLALARTGAPRPFAASPRALPALDRARLGAYAADKLAGSFVRGDGGLELELDGQRHPLGRADDLALALAAAHAAQISPRPKVPVIEDVDHQAVLEVILGPARTLSDPASKLALEPYDFPLPLEELCASPSRAAAEAARLGFPVRIALASPELRVSDHPELLVDGVESAAAVRDVFRQIMALARSIAEDARVLGVTVSASTTAKALLGLTVERLGPELCRCDLRFVDAHGLAAGDQTTLILPTTVEGIERGLARLRGAPLLFGDSPSERRHVIRAIGDVMLRLAVFLHDWPDEIERAELAPLAVLIGGDVEIREARVSVTDAFTRSLEEPSVGARRRSGASARDHSAEP